MQSFRLPTRRYIGVYGRSLRFKENEYIKNIKNAILILLLMAIFTGCSKSINKKIAKDLEIKLSHNIEFEYEDSHGGFHGYGVTLAKARLKIITGLVKKLLTHNNKDVILIFII